MFTFQAQKKKMIRHDKLKLRENSLLLNLTKYLHKPWFRFSEAEVASSKTKS